VERARIAALACLVGAVVCSSGAKAIEPSGAMAQAPSPAAANPTGALAGTTGKVTETMDAGRYTYLQVDLGNERIWAAAPKFEVGVGDQVTLPDGAMIVNHYSKTLDRTFDVIYFVPFVAVTGEDGKAGIRREHGGTRERGSTVDIDFSGVEKAEGGKTVGELFDERASLSGQEVAVRGRVVKVTPRVMGKNWIHLRDGTSGAGDDNDLTVTTGEMVEVGDTVLVQGVLSTDRDFGFGYKYDLIIEDASVTVE
jgi:hypothetical protein